ncbi:CBS domain-containing protein [Halalkalicoccus ordinarius]|uniref:CBS domain-containing protein n=1 Tax=Halalkalicoccus ordinarius TaxID=3116651 RepID=UPI00300F0E34
MDIADIATTDYTEADVGERFGKIRAAFEESNPKAIVITDDGEYAGIVTERQILQSHVEDNTKASAFMRSAPRIDRAEDIREVARMLVEGGTKAAPVFNGEDLSGLITADAILEAVLEHLDAITVEQIYTEDVVTVNRDTTVGQAINMLREHGISRLPVLSDDGRLEGIVTTHDLRDVIIRDMDKATVGDRAGDIERILDIPVYDVMNSPVGTADPEEAVSAAVSRMFDDDYNGLVVTLDANDRQVGGVVTKTDVLRALTFTEEEAMDVQITNIDLLDAISREDIRTDIARVTDKYREMQVHHAHVRFQKHKEKLRGTPLIQCQIRVRTNRGQVAGSGEGYGADAAFHVALDKLERNVLEMKGIQSDEEYEGQLLRKLNEI